MTSSEQSSKTYAESRTVALPDYVVIDIRSEVVQLMDRFQLSTRDAQELTEQVIGTFMNTDTLQADQRPVAELWRMADCMYPNTDALREDMYNHYCDYFHGIREKLVDAGMNDAIALEGGFNYGFKQLKRNGTLLVLKHLEN